MSTTDPVRAKAPVAPPAATGLATVVAVGVVALGIIAGRDALTYGGVTGTPWTTTALQFLDGLTAQAWMVPVGLGMAAVGALLVVASMKPRRRTHRRLGSGTDTWIATRDVARIARHSATRVTGVHAVTTAQGARRLTLTVTAVSGFDVAEVADAVRRNVSEALAPLAHPPPLKIRLREKKLS